VASAAAVTQAVIRSGGICAQQKSDKSSQARAVMGPVLTGQLPQVETYFRTVLKSPYWLGVGRATPTCTDGDYSCFGWRDGTNVQPDATPSSLAELSTAVNTYSHWGGKSTGYEPNTLNSNCAVADSTAYPAYYYYSGTATATDRKTASKYVSTTGQNVWAWRKVRRAGGGQCAGSAARFQGHMATTLVVCDGPGAA
jgi:hypothetical protein